MTYNKPYQNDYQQNNHQQGNFQQNEGYQPQGGGYQHENHLSRAGEASSYYNGGQHEPQQPYPQHGQQGGYGQSPYNFGQAHQNNQHQGSSDNWANQGSGIGDPEDGDRGVMGALAGGAAGAYGGHKIGGNVGHSKTSTVLGALAGAFAGHKLQDGVSDWKHKHDEEEDEHKHQQHDQNQHHDDKPRGGHFAGGFTGSSRDIRLDAHGDCNLHASCLRRDGAWQESCISLNKILANESGSFRWSSSGGGNGGQTTYTVQQGDTLRGIAARFGTNFEEVARRNNISNPDQIWPGQSLQVPTSGGSSSGNFGSSARNVRLLDGGQRLEAELMRNGDWVHSSIVLDERIGNNDGTLHCI